MPRRKKTNTKTYGEILDVLMKINVDTRYMLTFTFNKVMDVMTTCLACTQCRRPWIEQFEFRDMPVTDENIGKLRDIIANSCRETIERHDAGKSDVPDDDGDEIVFHVSNN